MLSPRMIHCCLLVLAMLAPACDSQPSEDTEAGMPPSSDPRCAALCTDELPDYDGAYDTCSTDSLSQCVDLCETRIENTENLCAECLLEDASFYTPVGADFDICGDDGTCYVGLQRFCDGGCWIYEGFGGDCGGGCEGAEAEYQEQIASGDACAYPRDDDAAQAACHAMLHPREEVSCSVEFQSVTDCAALCS